MLGAPESKWKRHTVLSNDSGYNSTGDLPERNGWQSGEVGLSQCIQCGSLMFLFCIIYYFKFFFVFIVLIHFLVFFVFFLLLMFFCICIFSSYLVFYILFILSCSYVGAFISTVILINLESLLTSVSGKSRRKKASQ